MSVMTGAARERATEPSALEPEVRDVEQQIAEPARKKSRRGFASMSAERQRAIASMGGRAAHEKGTAHEFTSDEAREAGRIGGEIAQKRRVERRRAAGR
jgi:general stress protein YciG